MFRIVGKHYAGGCIASGEQIPESLQEWVGAHMEGASLIPIPFSLAIIDLDRFTQYNTQHGHAAGDRVLQRIESKLERWLRSWDDVARSGNDEFGIVLWGPDKGDAVGACRRIKGQILQLEGVEASIGCATRGQLTKSAEILVLEAKMAMWRSRARGGNLITHFEDLVGENTDS